MAKEGFKNAAVRTPLADEAMRILRKHPWLGPPYLSTLLDRLLQEWVEKAYATIREREAVLGAEAESDVPVDDFEPRA